KEPRVRRVHAASLALAFALSTTALGCELAEEDESDDVVSEEADVGEESNVDDESAAISSTTLSITSWNVHEASAKVRRPAKTGRTFAALQEVDEPTKAHYGSKRIWAQQGSSASATNRPYGIGLYGQVAGKVADPLRIGATEFAVGTEIRRGARHIR